MYEEVTTNSWKGIRVRKGNKFGTITKDENGSNLRILTVQYDDSSMSRIVMNNIGTDPTETSKWEWQDSTEKAKWYQF